MSAKTYTEFMTPSYVEVYAFVALIYWGFIFSLSQYGSYLERRLTKGA